MKALRVPLAALLVGAVTAALLALDLPPALRGPESWRWGRRVISAWPGLVVVPVLVLLLARVAGAIRRGWAGGNRRVRARLLGAAVALVFAQMAALTASEPGGLANIPRRVMDPSFTTYHWIARDVTDVTSLLRNYPKLQRTFPVHGASQPPGRVLFFDAVNLAVSHGAWPARILTLAGHVGMPETSPRSTDSERAGAFVAGWLLLLIAALSVWPVAVLAGGRGDPDAVAASVLLMGTVPSVLLFTPETDALLLLLSLGAAALLAEAMRYASRAWTMLSAFGAGLLAGASILLSLTTLAALMAWAVTLGGMVFLARRRGAPMPTTFQGFRLAVAALAGLCVVPGAVAWVGLDWPAVMRECWKASHVVQVLVQKRDYATWVRWNLWDFVLFLGPSLTFAWLARVPAEARELFGKAAPSPVPPAVEMPHALALLAALVALDLSGTILGETGRIWMFLMPLAALAAGATTARSPASLRAIALGQLLVLLALRAFMNVPG